MHVGRLNSPFAARIALLTAAIVMLATGLPAQPAQPASGTPAAAQGSSAERVAVPEPTPQALAYHRSGTLLWLFNTLWALLLPAVLLWTGFSARMRSWSRAIGRRWFFIVAIYWI